MQRSPHQQRLFFLSLVFAVAPFGFALIRAISAHDLRMLWMAVAALVGAAVVVAIGKVVWPMSEVVFALSFVALVVAMLFAGVTAMLLGATAPFGIWAVAFVLSFCWAASYALFTRSRTQTA